MDMPVLEKPTLADEFELDIRISIGDTTCSTQIESVSAGGMGGASCASYCYSCNGCSYDSCYDTCNVACGGTTHC
jgi:hypothetical protein